MVIVIYSHITDSAVITLIYFHHSNKSLIVMCVFTELLIGNCQGVRCTWRLEDTLSVSAVAGATGDGMWGSYGRSFLKCKTTFASNNNT